jgi:cytochrome b-561 domain-containing protein 2
MVDLDVVARASTAVFTAYMAWVSYVDGSGLSSWKGSDGNTLFAWHPICMSLSFGIISVEALRAIQRRRSSITNVQIHSSLNDCAIILALVGFFAIYSRKDDLGKPHFGSWHSWAGLCALAGFVLNAAHGILRTTRLLGGHTTGKSASTLQWIWVSQFHRIAGSTSHVVAMIALILGLYSGWGVNVLGNFTATVLSALLVVGEIAILLKVKLSHGQ